MSKEYHVFTNATPAPIIWSDLFVPVAYKDPKSGKSAEPKYTVKMILDPANAGQAIDLAKMKQVFVAAARSKFPDPYDIKTLEKPFQSGDKINAAQAAKHKDPYDFLAGKVLFLARSKNPPTISYVDGRGKFGDAVTEAQFAEVKTLFYGGVECYISATLVPYQVGTAAPGVTAYLNKVFITRKGARLTGGPSSEEVFKDYIGHATNEDPTGGQVKLDDDIPF